MFPDLTLVTLHNNSMNYVLQARHTVTVKSALKMKNSILIQWHFITCRRNKIFKMNLYKTMYMSMKLPSAGQTFIRWQFNYSFKPRSPYHKVMV